MAAKGATESITISVPSEVVELMDITCTKLEVSRSRLATKAIHQLCLITLCHVSRSYRMGCIDRARITCHREINLIEPLNPCPQGMVRAQRLCHFNDSLLPLY